MKGKDSIIFETKCYENDWAFLLRTPLLEHMIDSCNHTFTEKRLYINNVKNLREVRHYADKKIAASVIDSYYLVEDHAAEALGFFNISEDSFKGGYYYSISELVSVYLSDARFILHLSSDALPVKPEKDWIGLGKELLLRDPEVITANLIWDNKKHEARGESLREDNQWWYSQAFCDQNYLIRTDYFRRDIYNEQSPDAIRYPGYGGESFEKRVFSHLKVNRKLRATFKEGYYYHRNFPKQTLAKEWLRWKMKYLNRYR